MKMGVDWDTKDGLMPWDGYTISFQWTIEMEAREAYFAISISLAVN